MLEKSTQRPTFPKRALITAGMPYGNKGLHFGHMGGLFVHADTFARFLRDRIGKENVIFVSGTDCYGSPIVEHHRRLVEKGEYTESIENFVKWNHSRQKNSLNSYSIDLNIYAASGFGRSAEIHRELCQEFFKVLYAHGYLKQVASPQFYDKKLKMLLNGRQVLGFCPVPGCSSEKAYADECSLGHPYEPKDLLKPVSALSGETPVLCEVVNWYIDLEKFRPELIQWVNSLEDKKLWRSFAISAIREFLEPPAVYVKAEHEELLNEVTDHLPTHERIMGKQKNQPIKLVFNTLLDRDNACLLLTAKQIRFRTGKTLVPFRLTGNVDWGVPAPKLTDTDNNCTFWVWPESLWAPISFTSTYLESIGKPKEDWKKWWCSNDAQVFQFIGEDNVYFYSLAEMGMFMGTQNGALHFPPKDGELNLPDLVVNSHILYFDKKASSSGAIVPPMADDLLNYYTSDQLRAHFLSLGLSLKSVGFKPKPFHPNPVEKESDPVLKEAMLLSNSLNKAVRTAFYTTQKYLDRRIPVGKVSQNILDEAYDVIFAYEHAMAKCTLHEVMAILDNYSRAINKHWTTFFKAGAQNILESEDLKQALIDNFHMIRIATVLFHPIAPTGTEMIREYLGVNENFWDWNFIFEPLSYFFADAAQHQLKELEPRIDFFPRHQSQVHS